MSFFCILGSRLLLLIILLFVKQRKQVIAVKCLFCQILKINVLKWKFWNCYLVRNFIAHTVIFFSKFCDQNWNFYRRNRHHSRQKSHSTLIFCNFLNRVHTQLPILRQLQYLTNTLWKFQTNRTNTLFAAKFI